MFGDVLVFAVYPVNHVGPVHFLTFGTGTQALTRGESVDELEKKFRKRILTFYFAGVVNLVIGLYVLFFGGQFMARGTSLLVALFFLGFAAVDFYFPQIMKKKWVEEQERLARLGNPPARA